MSQPQNEPFKQDNLFGELDRLGQEIDARGPILMPIPYTREEQTLKAICARQFQMQGEINRLRAENKELAGKYQREADRLTDLEGSYKLVVQDLVQAEVKIKALEDWNAWTSDWVQRFINMWFPKPRYRIVGSPASRPWWKVWGR